VWRSGLGVGCLRNTQRRLEPYLHELVHTDYNQAAQGVVSEQQLLQKLPVESPGPCEVGCGECRLHGIGNTHCMWYRMDGVC
jgi:hypothetical protein